ncbi:hypothetical protein ACKVMT_08695 [Halobacteriales archaeon Cl-PHB]
MHRDDGGLQHGVVGHECVLQFDAGYPLPAALNDVLGPVDDLEKAVVVDRHDVVRLEPVAVEVLLGCLGAVLVLGGDRWHTDVEVAERLPVPGDVVAVLGPTPTKLAFRFADGWVSRLFTRDRLRDRLEDFERGVDISARPDDDRSVSPVVRCCTHEDIEYARSLGRQIVSFLIGAYGPFYGTLSRPRATWTSSPRPASSGGRPGDGRDGGSLSRRPTGLSRQSGLQKTFALLTTLDALDPLTGPTDA